MEDREWKKQLVSSISILHHMGVKKETINDFLFGSFPDP